MMDSTDDVTNNDEIEKRVRTLWVGNLHPKVSNRDVAELFYQVGPVEYVEFAYDENDICENFALVVFKYPSSVEDSIKFFKGTKLYGLPIITKNYSKHFEDPVFNDQLNYFKQLIKVEQNCQPNNSSAESQWIDQSLNEKNIPESLPKPPMHEERGFNKNQDNYDRRCSSKVNSSKFRHNARHSKNHNSVNSGEHYPIDRSHRSQKHYKNSEHNSSSSSMEVSNYERDSYYHNSNNDRKHHDNTSFNRKESAYRYQEPRSMHDKDSSNDMIVRDLRDTMLRKRSRLDSNFHIDMNTNAGCTSLLDLRDTMYHRKNNRYEDQGQQHHESDSNNRWSERNQDMHGNGNFSNKEPRKNNYNSERYSESNTKHQNHYADRGYNRGKSHNGFQDCGNESTSNYNDGYRRDKNRPTNNKYNNPQNMESSSRQHNSYHPYQRNNEHSGQSRGRSYNKGGSDRSRHNYYS